MFQAKQEDASNSFVRDMKVLPEPAVIVASDYQLDDLVLLEQILVNIVFSLLTLHSH